MLDGNLGMHVRDYLQCLGLRCESLPTMDDAKYLVGVLDYVTGEKEISNRMYSSLSAS